MADETKLTLRLNENHLKKAKNFFSKYELVSLIGDSDEKYFLGEKENRVCRFCKKPKSEVKFKKEAHVIPEFMGNHNLVSFFECDDCNHIFSKYEDSFANYLGITRTISQIQGKKNKVPKYKDMRSGLEMTLGDEGLQMTSIDGTDTFELDEDDKSFTLKTKRPGYIPMHIPKLFIKIGISMLLDEELIDFEYTREFIINSDKDLKFKDSNLLRILGYFIPGPPKFKKPFVQLYQKKDLNSEEKLKKYILIFYYSSYQLQMILPFGKPDEHLQGQKIDVPIAPLMIDNSYLVKFGNERFLNLNLTSTEKKTGEEHNITFSFDSFELDDIKK
jgi:hypothetical protein